MAKRFEKAREYTQKYGPMLKPCKYCGNTDIRVVSDRTLFPKPKDVWSVVCMTPRCNFTGSHTKVRDAVARWNEIN